MGRTHRLETTFPRLSEPLGYVPKEDILYAIKAIVVTQRENGRRDDRKYSRMKYLVSSWGMEKFRSVVEQYYGKKFEPIRELPEWEFKSYLGWQKQVCVFFIICYCFHVLVPRDFDIYFIMIILWPISCLNILVLCLAHLISDL